MFRNYDNNLDRTKAVVFYINFRIEIKSTVTSGFSF